MMNYGNLEPFYPMKSIIRVQSGIYIRQNNADLTTNENILSIFIGQANDLLASVGCYQDTHQDI
jgi:hypothetical protein